MKLFQSTLNKALNSPNNDINLMTENLCPGGKRCKNYGIILSLEQKIKSLNDTVNQLTKINEYSESNHSRSHKTPKKIIEPKRQESFNEFCNSFRNSLKKKNLPENKRNLFGNITLPSQISEPYKIRPYNSISNESKVIYKKIPNKRHYNLDLNNIKNYKNKLYLKTESSDANNYHNYKNLTIDANNEQLLKNQKDNILKNNNDKDKSDENKKEEEKNNIQKNDSSLPQALSEEKKSNINNNEDNNNIKNIIIKKDINKNIDENNLVKKTNKKNEEEIKNKIDHKNIRINTSLNMFIYNLFIHSYIFMINFIFYFFLIFFISFFY
jgi:hypothetical protein